MIIITMIMHAICYIVSIYLLFTFFPPCNAVDDLLPSLTLPHIYIIYSYAELASKLGLGLYSVVTFFSLLRIIREKNKNSLVGGAENQG